MKSNILAIIALISILILSSIVPGALAEEEAVAGAVEGEVPEAGGDSSVAIGYVYAYVTEWKPDLEGTGAGLFTYSEFDFGEFFGKVAESLESLLSLLG